MAVCYFASILEQGVVEYLNTSLLQICRSVCQRKNFENQLTFGEVMGMSLVSCFLTHSVDITSRADNENIKLLSCTLVLCAYVQSLVCAAKDLAY